MSERIDKLLAIPGVHNFLAGCAFKKAEHLDPSPDGDSEADDSGWSLLTERKREFWRLLVKDILEHAHAVTAPPVNAARYGGAEHE